MGDELKAEVSVPDSPSSNAEVGRRVSGPPEASRPPRKPRRTSPVPEPPAESPEDGGDGRRRSLIPRPEGYRPRSSAPPAKPAASSLRRSSDPELAQLLGIEAQSPVRPPEAPPAAAAAPGKGVAVMPMKIIGISAPAAPKAPPEPAPQARPSPLPPVVAQGQAVSRADAGVSELEPPFSGAIPAADLEEFELPGSHEADQTLEDLEPPELSEPEPEPPLAQPKAPSQPQNGPPPLPPMRPAVGSSAVGISAGGSSAVGSSAVGSSTVGSGEAPPLRARPSDPSAPAPLAMAPSSVPAEAATPPETPALRLDAQPALDVALPSAPLEEVDLEEVTHDEGEPIELRVPRRQPPKLPAEDDHEVEVTVEAPEEVEERSSLRPPPPKRRLPKAPPPRVSFTGALDEDEADKPRPWWEEVFSDDFLRADFELTDEQIETEVRFIEESLGIERGGVILDLACGSGRHAIELAKRGYTAVGYDLSVSQLARASERAQASGVQVSFLQGDMREMAFEQMFDGVVCWNASFGYFEEEKNIAVLRNAYRALKPGGSFLLDIPNRDFVVSHQPSQNWFEGDACVCMDDMHVDFITSRLCVKRTLMLDDGRNRECVYSLRLYALHELGRMLHEVGFRVSEVTGHIAMRGVFMGATSPRLILLVVKP